MSIALVKSGWPTTIIGSLELKRDRENFMKFKYKLGIHSRDDSYEEFNFESVAPVSQGDYVSFGVGEDEYKVKQVIHYFNDLSIIHVDNF